MNKKYVFIIYIGLASISVLAYLGFVAYSYIAKKCQNSYGISYNKKRKELRIPLLPVNWSIKERSEDYIGWSGSEKNIGHKRKSVAFSGCNIEAELDVFRLPKQNGEERLLEMEYYYPRKGQSATRIYTYQIGSYANSISKMTADSILNAENIGY
ncbi:hypothetical protein [Pedobacter sp.]|jgi:hypothetical protein|uniref:hypothetical protein n=1 Tax=Pedobacter sp. TaxID=1411316 RepID=UPI002BEC8F11|nr:hypothetical protein [Pedobacter sp.]HWW39310.1 hypothetical protein [Pedobacter sp.]